MTITVRLLQHLKPPASFSSFVDVQVYIRSLYDALFKVMQGKTQNVLAVTLTANSASTVIADARISPQTCIAWDARTANAAAELGNGTLYITDANRGKSTLTVTHANNAQTDRDFLVAFIG